MAISCFWLSSFKPLFSKVHHLQTYLVVLWSWLCASNAGGMGSILGQGTKIPQVIRFGKKKKKKLKAHDFLLGILSSRWMCLGDSDQDSSTPSLMGREMAQARTVTCSLLGIWILTGGSKKQKRVLFHPSLLEPAFRLPAGVWILSSRNILIPAYFQASILLLILWTPNILPKYFFN